MTLVEDGALVERARARDEAAFAELVRRYTPLLLGYLLGKLRDRGDAEDLAQEVWLTAYRQLAGLRQPDRLGAWLMRVARNRLVDLYRQRAAGPQLVRMMPEDGEPEEWGAVQVGGQAPPDPVARARAGQLREAVLDALSGLHDRYRVVVYLRLIGEAPSTEIARRLGLKESAVRMRLQRGLEKLRKVLIKRGITPPGE